MLYYPRKKVPLKIISAKQIQMSVTKLHARITTGRKGFAIVSEHTIKIGCSRSSAGFVWNQQNYAVPRTHSLLPSLLSTYTYTLAHRPAEQSSYLEPVKPVKDTEIWHVIDMWSLRNHTLSLVPFPGEGASYYRCHSLSSKGSSLGRGFILLSLSLLHFPRRGFYICCRRLCPYLG